MTIDMADALGAPDEFAGSWAKAAWQLGATVAAPAAAEVDTEARFPHETLEAFRAGGFLSSLIPVEYGGGGASILEMMNAVRAVANHCVSSSLILAMHCIEVVNLNRHGRSNALRDLSREIASNELLIANANSEVGLGGDVGRSVCAVDTTTTPWSIEKHALAISYGEYADLIMSTARRSRDAPETDQAFCVLRQEKVTLTPLSEWDTLGLRGTCSRGFLLHGEVDPELIFPVPFSTVANDGGGQARQLLLSATWVGLAEAAAGRAHAYLRAAARRNIGVVPPGALRLAEIAASVDSARATLAACAQRFDELDAVDDVQNAGLIIELRNLKVTTSNIAVRCATGALEICGITGYQRNSPFSIERLIRDAHGGLIMVSNDRLLHDNAQLLLARKTI
jgi:acyl-CoA dehydrogenase